MAIVSYASVIGFVRLMVHLEETQASGIARSVALLSGQSIFYFWGFVLYRIGLRASYWSPAALRAWQWAGRFALAVFCLHIAGLILQVILAYFRAR